VKVTVNGAPADVPSGASVAEILAALGHDPSGRGLAVAIDGEVVPRRTWSEAPVAAGSRLEVLAAAQGG
jgi:sulfur carrier protein